MASPSITVGGTLRRDLRLVDIFHRNKVWSPKKIGAVCVTKSTLGRPLRSHAIDAEAGIHLSIR
jgi:hypothetical protein